MSGRMPKADYKRVIKNHNLGKWILLEWRFTVTSKDDTSLWGGRRNQHGGYNTGCFFYHLTEHGSFIT